MTSLFFALRRGAILAVTTLLAVALVACSGGGETSDPTDNNLGGGTVSVIDGTVAISADDLEFDANVIQATAGEGFTVSFSNLETEPHNWSIYTEEGGDPIAQGAVLGEGEIDEIVVPALDAGEYFFVCDVHPEMTGTVVVEG
ncbi:MAG TPA: cupredoxin domain-containing protein [Candidatus Binatia bacterium]|nr:cupredoxin domain-containing protein [Candidatus Binatia bacterium]